jgi:hypothetical protein
MKHDPPLRRLSDAELQERIDRFGKQMLEANARFRQTHAIEDRSERDNAWITQKALLQERSRRRRIVDRMEQEIGLR